MSLHLYSKGIDGHSGVDQLDEDTNRLSILLTARVHSLDLTFSSFSCQDPCVRYEEHAAKLSATTHI